MSYIDGFIIAVPTANKQKFIDHAGKPNQYFMDQGAIRIRECWGDGVVAKMEDDSKFDERINPDINPMPFDGARMIYGGFSSVVELDAG